MSTAKRAVVVSTVIERSPAHVWADVRNIESHVSWMQDAAEIRLLTEHREGPGTRFECDTKVGTFLPHRRHGDHRMGRRIPNGRPTRGAPTLPERLRAQL